MAEDPSPNNGFHRDGNRLVCFASLFWGKNGDILNFRG
jgi:hypothetical protein